MLPAAKCRCTVTYLWLGLNLWRLGFGVAGHRANNIHIHNHILKIPHPSYVIATRDGCWGLPGSLLTYVVFRWAIADIYLLRGRCPFS